MKLREKHKKNEQDSAEIGVTKNSSNVRVENKVDQDADEMTSTRRKVRILEERNDHRSQVNYQSSNENEETMDKSSAYLFQTHTQVSSINDKLFHVEDSRPFSCLLCPKKFKLSHQLKRHDRVHTGERPYRCSYCSKTFSQSHSLNYHQVTHRGDHPYECPKCDKKFVGKAGLTEHLHRLHPQSTNYICPHANCAGKFAKQFILNKHIKDCHGITQYKCFTCNVEFPVLTRLKKHYESKKHLSLSEVEKQIEKKRWFKSKSCTANQNVKCQVSSKSYKINEARKESSDRSKSKENLHDGEQANIFTNIQISTVKRWTLEDGQDLKGIELFECNLCLKSFKTSRLLESHQRKMNHNEESPHECPVCLENFRTIHLMGQHYLVHETNPFFD